MRAKLANVTADNRAACVKRYLSQGRHDLYKSEKIRVIRKLLQKYNIPLNEEGVSYVEEPNSKHEGVLVTFNDRSKRLFPVPKKNPLNTPLEMRQLRTSIFNSRQYYAEKQFSMTAQCTQLFKELGFTYK